MTDDKRFYPIQTNLAGVTYTPPDKEQPQRSEGGQWDDYKETHPAYGIIGASRSQGGKTALFGSDFNHNGYITILLQHAQKSRGLHSDRVHATGEPWIAEVILSEAQWATFVSTLNMGEGVPCTINRLDGVKMPDIEPIAETRTEELDTELRQTFADLDKRLADLEGKLTGARKQDVGVIRSHLRSNIPFVAQRFGEHAEETVEKMKIEVSAYITGAIQRAGIASLGEGPPITLIEGGDEAPS